LPITGLSALVLMQSHDKEIGMVRNKLSPVVVGGVDTHAATHHAAVLDARGALLGSAQFPATGAGYSDLLGWMSEFGRLHCVGVEGTGAYGAGLARHLHGHGVVVLEVPRPDRRLRRRLGKSDPIDAEAAARAVLAGTASARPKLSNGPMEAIRALRGRPQWSRKSQDRCCE
jgi:transposase